MNHIKNNSLYIIWITALLGMVGSLYFQYVLHFTPCAMCWYQRIAIYPLVLIIPIGLLKNDKLLPLYTLALGIAGLLLSFYHNLLYYKIIPESIAPCVIGVPCTTRYIHLLGFLDIPQLSFISLVIIIVASVFALKNNKNI